MSHLRAPADRRPPRSQQLPPLRPQLTRIAVLPPVAVALGGGAAVLYVVLTAGVPAGPVLWAVLAGAVALAVMAVTAAAVAARHAAQSVEVRVAELRRRVAHGEAELREAAGEPERHAAPGALGAADGGAEVRRTAADGFVLLAEDLERAHRTALAALARSAPETAPQEGENEVAADGPGGPGVEHRLEVFLNVARRLQSLAHREIAVLDELEREIEDPDLLKGLFHVDHLATRVRRHAENLAVLGGAVSRRQWSEPIPVEEVLRSAVAEVEQYARVRVVPPVEGSIRGHAVADVIHLLAELVENATVFSPPHTQVAIRAEAVAAGLAVEVEDRGLGMPSEEQDRMNALLADPGTVDVGGLLADGRIGLYVVSQLARRHGVRVRLGGNIYGGVQAVLVLPQSLLGPATTEPSPAASDTPADVGEWPPGGTAAPPSAAFPAAGLPAAVEPATAGFPAVAAVEAATAGESAAVGPGTAGEPAAAVFPATAGEPARAAFPGNAEFPATAVEPATAGEAVATAFPAADPEPAGAASPTNAAPPATAVEPVAAGEPGTAAFPADAAFSATAGEPVTAAEPDTTAFPAAEVGPVTAAFLGNAAFPATAVHPAHSAEPPYAAGHAAPRGEAVPPAPRPGAAEDPSAPRSRRDSAAPVVPEVGDPSAVSQGSPAVDGTVPPATGGPGRAASEAREEGVPYRPPATDAAVEEQREGVSGVMPQAWRQGGRESAEESPVVPSPRAASPEAPRTGPEAPRTGPGVPLPVRERIARPTPAGVLPGTGAVEEPPAEPPRPRLPRRRAQSHLAPQLRPGPLPRPEPGPDEETGHDPLLMAAFRRGVGLAEAQDAREPAVEDGGPDSFSDRP
ncbi:ATP-binding protein [Streptomyces sp. NPDC005012]|uniref:ATP-binding protein n=1 Tax=Streptomyces sp. NPDC005012 TaxID=3154558 RepID=UPI0033B22C3F